MMKMFLIAMFFLALLFLSSTATPPTSYENKVSRRKSSKQVTSQTSVESQPLSKPGRSESTPAQIIVDLIWAPGFCKDDRIKCKQVPSHFITHGIWKEPEFVAGDRPGKDFQSDQVRQLEADLLKYYPDLDGPAGKFRISYYRKIFFTHGKYFYPDFSSRAYFSLAIKLTKTHGGNILRALTDQGIKPGGDRYTLGEIVQVIESYSGFTPKVVSKKIHDDISGRNYSYLSDIRVCMDIKGRLFVKCIIDTSYIPDKYIYFAQPY